MSSSGLIYAVIVGLWAAYLVPMWLRRQDELAESGSQDRLFTAVRVLTRRPPVAPPAPVAVDTETAPRPRPRKPPSRRRARLLARRRRVVSGLFLSFTAGSALTAWYGTVWVGLPAVTGLLLSLYIVYLRAQERRRTGVRRRHQRAEAAIRDGHGDPAGHSQVAARAAGTDSWVRHGQEPQDPDAWDPVPVPLPTYVTAPVVLDGTPWTSERPGAAAQHPDPARGAPGAAGRAVYDQHSDDDRPRAVND